MARPTKRQLKTFVSAIYLTLLTILAALALHSANYYSLPIPNLLGAFTVALPPLAGVALETIISFQSSLVAKGKLRHSKIYQVVDAFFLIYEAVIATLAGTHIAPVGGLLCPLQDKWMHMFQIKDSRAVQAIQDAFNCCGFRTPMDMAFPFADREHGADSCMIRYERDTSCMEPWRMTERRVAIMMMVVPLAVFGWKVALFMASRDGISWLPSAIRLPGENVESNTDGPRPAITFRDVEEETEADSLRDEVGRLNTDSNLATHIEGGTVRPSQLIQEAENWGRE